MKSLLLLLMFAACNPAGPPADPAQQRALHLQTLRSTVTRWEVNPGPEPLDRVGIEAAEAMKMPPGDRAYDLELARVLGSVLLRPDLALARLAPHEQALTVEGDQILLDVLLRSGELQRFDKAVQPHLGRHLKLDNAGLLAAQAQSTRFREIGWRQAVYAHDASELASRQVTRGRKALDRPMPSLTDSIEALQAMLPDWRIALATTRSTQLTDPPAAETPGAVPAPGDKRRVIAYGNSSTPGSLMAAARLTDSKPPAAVFGIVVAAEHDDGPTLMLCGEGRIQDGHYWLVSACDPEQQVAWIEASERWVDLSRSGASVPERVEAMRRLYADKLLRSVTP